MKDNPIGAAIVAAGALWLAFIFALAIAGVLREEPQTAHWIVDPETGQSRMECR